MRKMTFDANKSDMRCFCAQIYMKLCWKSFIIYKCNRSFGPCIFCTGLFLVVCFHTFLQTVCPPCIESPICTFNNVSIIHHNHPTVIYYNQATVLLSGIALFEIFYNLCKGQLLSFAVVPVSIINSRFKTRISSGHTFFLTARSLSTRNTNMSKKQAGKPTADFLSHLLYYTFIFLFCEYHFSKIPEISPEFSAFYF